MQRIRLALVLVAAVPVASCDIVVGGGDRALAEQVVHAGGTVLQLVSVRRGSDRVEVTATILNGRNGDITLNRGVKQTYILLDDGTKLPLVAATQNADLAIPGGRLADVSMVFAGALPAGGQATLIINANGSADNRFSTAPRFEAPLPLDGLGTASVPEASRMSGLRPVPASSLRPVRTAGSTIGGGAQSASRLQQVQTLRSELGARQTDRGTLVSLAGDITFDFDKATIRPAARPVLDRLAQLIAAQQATAVAIEGHTDSKGDDAYNQTLSNERAEAVKAYLVAKGVAAAALVTRGFGETRPVAEDTGSDSTDDEAARQRNRRVEVILSGSADPSAPAST